MIAKIAPLEALALAHLRQWGHDRMRTRHGRTSHNYQRPGCSVRSTNNQDAAIVRCIDFERALSVLDPDEQVIIVWATRDRWPQPEIARAVGCSTRTVHTRLQSARAKLAAELDKLGVL